jgi:ferrous iron transport protein A
MRMSVSSLADGAEGIIAELNGGPGFQRRLRTMGIREGKVIRIVTSHPFGGPIVVLVGGRQTTIGRGIANRILIDIQP